MTCSIQVAVTGTTLFSLSTDGTKSNLIPVETAATIVEGNILDVGTTQTITQTETLVIVSWHHVCSKGNHICKTIGSSKDSIVDRDACEVARPCKRAS
jgi:hypothetical protein